MAPAPILLLAPDAAGLVTVNTGAVTANGNAVVATSVGGGDTQGYGLRAGFRC